jgi:hypothetical protein
VNENGSGVSGWEDMSGNGNAVSQPTASKQPGLEMSGLGDRPELTFDGADDVLTGSSLFGSISMADDWTAVVVCSGWTWGPADSHNDGRAVLGAPTAGGGYWNQSIYTELGGGPGGGFYNGVSHESAAAAAAGAEGADMVWVMTDEGGDLAVRVNGTAGTTVVAAGSMQSSATTLGVGWGTAGTSRWDGSISEVLIFDGALSTEELEILESYLLDRYRIAA